MILTYFAEGIISEILSYLRVKSWLMCKSVCELQYAIIKKNEFVKMHMRRNNGRFHVFKCNDEIFNSDGIKDTYQYLSSINGLLLEERKLSTTMCARYQIGNPSTKRNTWYSLSEYERCLLAITIYLDSSTGLYNLVSVSSDQECSNFVFTVLDLGCHLGCPGTYLWNCEYLFWRTLNIT